MSSKKIDRDALSRTAQRLRRSSSDQITQKEAEQIVAHHLERADRQTKK